MRPVVFISHSSRDDPWATELRAELVGSLRKRGFDAWVDDARLGAGDRWRSVIYRQLVACRGAVLLLSPDALRSPWVRKEATILSFRGSIHARFRLLPVLLGGVTRADVEEALPKLYLFDNQYEKVAAGDPVSPGDFAEAIAESFAHLGADVPDDMMWWTRRVTSMLSRAPHEILQMATAHLAPDEEPDLDDSGELMAHTLLHGSISGVFRALRELIGTGVDLPPLIEQIIPAVVDEAMAGPVRAAMHSETRVVGINGISPDTGTVFARRACCCSTSMIAVPVGLIATEQTVTTAVDTARQAIADRFGMERPPNGAFLAEQGLALVFVISAERLPSRTLAQVIDRIRAEWRTAAVVVLTGRQRPNVQRSVSDLQVEMAEGDERRLEEYVHGLRSLPRFATG